jgi:hypothetical protein
LIQLTGQGIIKDGTMTALTFSVIRRPTWTSLDMSNPQSYQPQGEQAGEIISRLRIEARLPVGLHLFWQAMPGEARSQRGSHVCFRDTGFLFGCWIEFSPRKICSHRITYGVQVHPALLLEVDIHLEVDDPSLMYPFS